MAKIAIDAGHGINTSGKRTPADEREWSFNNKVVVSAISHLKRYKGVQILRLDDSTGKTDVPLITRTKKANDWGADILVSVHHNANAGVWGSHTGTETYTYTGSWPKAEKLAQLVHKRLLKAYGLKDRGLRKKDLHMCRESKMPAILTEGGFMDSTIDIKKLRDDKVLEKAGQAIAEGIAEYLGIKKESSTTVSKDKSTTASKPAKSSKLRKVTGSLGNDVYGVVTITTAQLNIRKSASLTSQIVDVAKKGESFKVYAVKNGLYHLGGNKYCSSSNKYSTFKKNPDFGMKKGVHTVTVKAESLWVYNKADWNSKHKTVKKGEVFTVVKTLTVKGSKMYQLKSGLYITANPSYVKYK